MEIPSIDQRDVRTHPGQFHGGVEPHKAAPMITMRAMAGKPLCPRA